MTQYIKVYGSEKKLINLSYVKEIFVCTNENGLKELVFTDLNGKILLHFLGQTNVYIDECFSKIEKFIEEQKDVIFNLY